MIGNCHTLRKACFHHGSKNKGKNKRSQGNTEFFHDKADQSEAQSH